MPSERETRLPVSTRRGWPWEPAGGDRFEAFFRDKRWPRITVVTPSLNQRAFLEAALRSVLLQNYPELEYLVLDGGSSDGSPEIIREYEPHLTYWHSRPDGGQADAVAAGFEQATGDIFCWLNSDDILLPGALRRVAHLFTRHRATDFIYSNRLVIDKEGLVVDRHIWPYLLSRYHWALGQPLAQECCFWKSELYRRVGGIDRSKFFIMDYDLFYRMWRIGKFRKTTAYLGCLRVHEESKNAKHRKIWRQELRQATVEFGLVEPGYFVRRLLNRVDRIQVLFDETMQKLRHDQSSGTKAAGWT